MMHRRPQHCDERELPTVVHAGEQAHHIREDDVVFKFTGVRRWLSCSYPLLLVLSILNRYGCDRKVFELGSDAVASRKAIQASTVASASSWIVLRIRVSLLRVA